MFSKDKQRTLALGNRMLLQCAAPREWTPWKGRERDNEMPAPKARWVELSRGHVDKP